MVSQNNHCLEFPATSREARMTASGLLPNPHHTLLTWSLHYVCTPRGMSSCQWWGHCPVLCFGLEKRMPIREEGAKCRKRCQEGPCVWPDPGTRLCFWITSDSVVGGGLRFCGRRWFERLELCVPGAISAESFLALTLLSRITWDAPSEEKNHLWTVLKRS